MIYLVKLAAILAAATIVCIPIAFAAALADSEYDPEDIA
jgi:hypothetical protein